MNLAQSTNWGHFPDRIGIENRALHRVLTASVVSIWIVGNNNNNNNNNGLLKDHTSAWKAKYNDIYKILNVLHWW